MNFTIGELIFLPLPSFLWLTLFFPSHRHIIKSNLFAPVVDAFIRNNGRYNLLESAILELFEFIKLEDIKSLCTYVVVKFGKTFDEIQYVQTFKSLRIKYDQHQDRLKEKENGGLERWVWYFLVTRQIKVMSTTLRFL